MLLEKITIDKISIFKQLSDKTKLVHKTHKVWASLYVNFLYIKNTRDKNRKILPQQNIAYMLYFCDIFPYHL